MTDYLTGGYQIPVSYDFLDLYTSKVSPSTVHTKNTNLHRFFCRYLLQKIFSVFKFGMPKEWDKDYFYYTLFCLGNVAVINTSQFGVIPQQCTPGGLNVFYRPSYVIVTNPLIKDVKMPRIGEECALIKLQPDYGGIMDLVSFYADMLALTAEAAGVNLMNSHLAYVFVSDNKAAAEAFKKMFDQVSAGNPAVFVDTKLFKDDGTPAWQTFAQNLQQNYLAGDLMADFHRWMNLFNTEIGIPNANFEKSERLITDEVNANNTDTQSKAQLWLETIQKGIDEANKLFGLDLSVKLRYEYEAPEEDTEEKEDEEDDPRNA